MRQLNAEALTLIMIVAMPRCKVRSRTYIFREKPASCDLRRRVEEEAKGDSNETLSCNSDSEVVIDEDSNPGS